MTIAYVLGFAENIEGSRVALIRKAKPEWQAGKLNGVGGKIELFDQNKYHAMAREFLEETGVETHPEQWNQYVTLVGYDYIVYVMVTYMMDEKLDKVRTMTEEAVGVYDVRTVENEEMCVSNLRWLLEMLYDYDIGNYNLEVHYGKR